MFLVALFVLVLLLVLESDLEQVAGLVQLEHDFHQMQPLNIAAKEVLHALRE